MKIDDEVKIYSENKSDEEGNSKLYLDDVLNFINLKLS